MENYLEEKAFQSLIHQGFLCIFKADCGDGYGSIFVSIPYSSGVSLYRIPSMSHGHGI